MTGHDARPVLDVLRDPATIRDRCGNVLAEGLAGRLTHFAVDLGRLPAAADLVSNLTRQRYPDLKIPPHSRWRHFETAGIGMPSAITKLPADERVRVKIDLVVTSVLLDAGAGDEWRYRDAATGRTFTRSEGLAVASLRMLETGVYAADRSRPCRADAEALETLDENRLAAGLQVSADNPLAGFEGRVGVLRRLGRSLRKAPDVFGSGDVRPGNLFDTLRGLAGGAALPAPIVLQQVLTVLASVWTGRLTLDGSDLGDTWIHGAAGGHGRSKNFVPFHKLSQWLVYSLVEPLEEGGVHIAGLEHLSGLAEYRNGGLFIDLDVLVPRHSSVTRDVYTPESELVVEWRALTVALLDRLAPQVAERLGLAGGVLPAVQLLEGGTWAAGRALAEARRGGRPPIRVASDGTIF